MTSVLKLWQKYPVGALKQRVWQPDGRNDQSSVPAAPTAPGFPLAALTAATAVSHSDALAIGVRPALAHVAPSAVRTTYSRVAYARGRKGEGGGGGGDGGGGDGGGDGGDGGDGGGGSGDGGDGGGGEGK